MWNKDKSVIASIVACFTFGVILTAAVFCGPWAAKLWFITFRGMNENSAELQRLLTAFATCFYTCAPCGYTALYFLLKLLFNIKREETFVMENVKCLRGISWCCLVVAVITGIGGCVYTPFWFIAIAAAFVGLLLRVVKNVMHSAVKIKEENELTI